MTLKRTAFLRCPPAADYASVPVKVAKPPKGPRTRKCGNPACRAPFAPRSMTHKACGPDCAQALTVAKRQKQERKADRERKHEQAPISKLARRAQAVINLYVRLRDAHLPCVSCDRPASWGGQWHASHLKSRGANSALRFNLWNVHKSCSICNHHLSGNIGEYRWRLIERIGAAKLEFLDCHERSRQYTREYLLRLIAVFTKKIKRKLKRKS